MLWYPSTRLTLRAFFGRSCCTIDRSGPFWDDSYASSVSNPSLTSVTFFKQMQTALCSCDSLPYSPPLPVLFVFCAAAISSEVAWGEGLGAGLGSGCEWLISKVIDKVNVDILTVSSFICFGWLAIVSKNDMNGGRLCRILARTRRPL